LFIAYSLEIAVDYFDQLFFRIAGLIPVGFDLNQVRADVVFKYNCQQTVHGAPTASDLLKHVHTAALLDQGSVNRLYLAPNTPYPV
jgi:hypothetical protein